MEKKKRKWCIVCSFIQNGLPSINALTCHKDYLHSSIYRDITDFDSASQLIIAIKLFFFVASNVNLNNSKKKTFRN